MRDRTNHRALRLCLIAISLLLLSGCSKGAPGQVTKVGDKLYLPSDCRIERYNASVGIKTFEFTKFDGNYPQHWPDGLLLPPSFYLLNPPLELKDAKNPDAHEHGVLVFDLDGVVRLPYDLTVSHFRAYGQTAGFRLESFRYKDTRKIAQQVGMTDQKQIEASLLEWGEGTQRIVFRKKSGSVDDMILLDISSDSDMDGYTFLRGYISVYFPELDMHNQ